MRRRERPPSKKSEKALRLAVWTAVIVAVVLACRYVINEMRTSRRQAQLFASLADRMTFEAQPGPCPLPLASPAGPYEQRLGYARLADITRMLSQKQFAIAQQACVSEPMHTLTGWGLFPIYHEKTEAGIEILDRYGKEIYARVYPARVFASFSDIPPAIVEMLLLIENRELLDAQRPFLNPAVEWDRLGRAILDQVAELFDPERSVPGGSTLATQMEKFRHSEQGITHSAPEKLEQMLSASVRAYLDGEETLEARRKIILDYLNSVPLAARPDYGEINGLGDGLWAWYGADFGQVVETLREGGLECGPGDCKARALAIKQVLSLFVAHKRPTEFLLKYPKALEEQCEAHLRLLESFGLISRTILDLAMAAHLSIRPGPLPAPPMTLVEKKAANAVRTRLLTLLGVDKFYDLDRMDLTVKSTLDLPTQVAITQQIIRLHDPKYVASHGLNGFRLLETGDVGRVIYSFTLYERTALGNLLRVQTDNYDQPLNINEGVKLDLGSTAKLRTLITYLEIVASLHGIYSGMPEEDLVRLAVPQEDRIAQWAVSYFLGAQDRSLPAMLRAAMERTYSASPYEGFFTGGGLHTFENFNKEDDAKILSVRDGLRNSINLVFIRLMRDIVRHYMYTDQTGAANPVLASGNPQRNTYLAKFADYEGSKFIGMFYKKYHGKSREDALSALLQSVRPVPRRLVAVYRSAAPEATYEEFLKFLKQRVPASRQSEAIGRAVFERYAPDKFNLADRGYLARLHPLELWVAAYLYGHPEASLDEVLKKSASERQEVYRWLFRPSQAGAQNKRIKIMLEIDAFVKIHQQWKKLGYPFGSLVPSYATAIGSSGDRPAALTELMGIILNNGIHLPSSRVEELHFAPGTPYEVLFVREKAAGERVLPREITDVVKDALYAVVETGTAVRANRCFVRPDRSVIRVGGKTGTGDHRYETFGSDGRLLTSRVMNRTSVFTFFIGDRFFGTITAYVPGQVAGEYGFTSSLPVAILKMLTPQLMPLLTSADQNTAAAAQAPEQPAPQAG